MLKQLIIRNFTIIENLDIVLKPGMTVFTGETGAGKSILVDALGLIMGDRAEAGLVRGGCDKAEITAIFNLTNGSEIQEILSQREIEPEDNEILIRRVINRDGPSRGFINDSPATAQLLKEVGEYLIDIHGQHAHQSLIKPDKQRDLLDEYGGHAAELSEVRKHQQSWVQITKQLEELQGSNDDNDAAVQLLTYQVDELQTLNPVDGEYETIEEEHRRLSNISLLLETAGKAINVFKEDDQSVYSRMNSILSELQTLEKYDSALININRILDEAIIQINEATDELRHYSGSLEIDPHSLQEVEKRLSALHDMARKHQVQPEQLHSHLEGLQQQLDILQNSQQTIEELKRQQQDTLNNYLIATTELSECRSKAARKLSKEITGMIKRLGMPNGEFQLRVEHQTDLIPRPYGHDQIEFLINLNPGQSLQPLRKVASGGELSRISLAIQVICTNDKQIGSLIFDEVDSGIGGGIAEITGTLLHELAGKRQVFCVTHLAQVASQGDQHLLVDKSSSKTSTNTQVSELSPEQRIEEIARMLGGLKITEQTLEHAREMLGINSKG